MAMIITTCGLIPVRITALSEPMLAPIEMAGINKPPEMVEVREVSVAKYFISRKSMSNLSSPALITLLPCQNHQSTHQKNN